MGALVRKLESPVLTDVSIDWPAGTEAWPRTIPDLYAGEPIVVTAALTGVERDVTLRARHGDKPWQATLPRGGNGTASGIGVVWARGHIDALDAALSARAHPDDLRADVVRVALAHRLVSEHTSVVAVDVTPTAPAGVHAIKTAIPENLPHGKEFEAIFGGLPQTATAASRDLHIAAIAL